MAILTLPPLQGYDQLILKIHSVAVFRRLTRTLSGSSKTSKLVKHQFAIGRMCRAKMKSECDYRREGPKYENWSVWVGPSYFPINAVIGTNLAATAHTNDNK